MSEPKPRLSEITNVVEGLQERMGEYGSSLCKSEELTRYVLVDPFLKALGWDTSKPEKVWVDYRLGKGKRKRVDYALFHKKKVIAFVEAKKYGACSQMDQMDNMLLQLINYCNLTGVLLGILTDGGCWLVYDVHKPAPIEEKMLLEINFAWDASKVAQKSLALSASSIENFLKQAESV